MAGLLLSFSDVYPLVLFAPFSNSLILKPAMATGSKPTGVSTENLPPTSSGIMNVLYPSISERLLNAPLDLSVIAIILEALSVLPYFFSMWLFNILKATAGSVVVPDFEITTAPYS